MATRVQSAGPSGRTFTGIRTGRFSSDTAGEEITIVKGRTGAFYRILNPGETEFAVYDGNSTIPVKASQSLDVAVKGRVRVTATHAPMKGIYDYLEGDSLVRSGRFRREVGESDLHTIIDLNGGGKSLAFYRILNSGEWPIRVMPFDTTVLPENSFDFAVGSSRSVTVGFDGIEDTRASKTAAAVAGPYLIEGIYDFLGTQSPVRNGRFKIRKPINDSGPAVDPSEAGKHMIIDASATTGKQKAWYRIFNSGQHPIYLHGPNAAPIETLKSGNSIDLELPAASLRQVYVRSDDPEKAIEGIYDFLDEAE